MVQETIVLIDSMLQMTPGGWARNLEINESFLVGKIYQTTKSIDLDRSLSQNLDEIAYFDSISPLNGPGDPPVRDLESWKLLKMVERCLNLLASSIKPLN